jgi:hypothetical protein
MTPEAAHDLGKRTASAMFDLAGYSYSTTEILEDVEANIASDATSRLLDAELAQALRGSASFWRELAEETDARAAAIEATR